MVSSSRSFYLDGPVISLREGPGKRREHNETLLRFPSSFPCLLIFLSPLLSFPLPSFVLISSGHLWAPRKKAMRNKAKEKWGETEK